MTKLTVYLLKAYSAFKEFFNNISMPAPETYFEGLARVFGNTFPDPLSEKEYLQIIDQSSPEAAEHLEKVIWSPEIQSEQERIRTLRTSVVIVWGTTGISTLDLINNPPRLGTQTPDIHVPSPRYKVPRRTLISAPSQTPSSPVADLSQRKLKAS